MRSSTQQCVRQTATALTCSTRCSSAARSRSSTPRVPWVSGLHGRAYMCTHSSSCDRHLLFGHQSAPCQPGMHMITNTAAHPCASTECSSHSSLMLHSPLCTPPATGGVLIHCAAGRSRSAAIAVAYIMRTERLSAKSALASVRCAQVLQTAQCVPHTVNASNASHRIRPTRGSNWSCC